MKTILVTGGAGFIGGSFVRYLSKKYPHYKIIVLDALTYAGNIQNLPEGSLNSDHLEFWYGNIRDPSMVHNVVSRSDIVVHFAAESHVTRSIYDNMQFFETDVIGTQVIANSVQRYRDKIELFVHISSSEVYGTASGAKMSEDHPLNPMSPYASAKCGADRLVHSYYATYGIPSVIIRPFNNYGPRQHLEKLIPRFITSCILGEPMKVHGDGRASRDWLHVSDHCEALDMLIHADRQKLIGQVINLGTGRDINILEIAKAIQDRFGKNKSKIEYITNRPGQVFRHTCDFNKAKELLGWEPRTQFEDGLDATIEWYKNNESWWRPQMWMRDIPIINADGKKVMH